MKIKYTSQQIEKLWTYMNFLIQENKKYNLTNITTEKEIIKKHFLDSLAPFSEVDMSYFENIIDIGTGAGFPGMVWKIFYPQKNFLLVDSTLKKVKFLKLLSVKLNLYNNLEIKHERAEDLGNQKEYREKFDLVLSRAVAPLNILSEYTLPFASKGSFLFYFKGPNYKKEIENSERAFKKLGGILEESLKLNIPLLEAERYLIVYKKTKNTPDKYPRKAGVPKKKPL
ncbi:MAG: 16S rRNA (guanine(527)-N(7))-methyltransferase RsmG [Bacillota bacterium]